MSRPARIDTDSEATGWVANINDNFEALTEAPLPLALYASSGALTSARNPKLYKDCFAMVGEVLYWSNGTTWNSYREQLDYMADLNPGTATLSDIVDAYNDLIDDMQDKGWMN